MTETVTPRECIEAECRAAMAALAALPRARRWDIEADRLSKRAKVEALLDDYLHADR